MYKEVLCLEVLGLSVRPHYHNNRYHHHLLPLHHYAVVGGFHQVGSTLLITDNSPTHDLFVVYYENPAEIQRVGPKPDHGKGETKGSFLGLSVASLRLDFPRKKLPGEHTWWWWLDMFLTNTKCCCHLTQKKLSNTEPWRPCLVWGEKKSDCFKPLLWVPPCLH